MTTTFCKNKILLSQTEFETAKKIAKRTCKRLEGNSSAMDNKS
jgi:hypothetical protein